ncbi:MAG: type II toxin-antitoxin system RelE/ParE family toxin [Clostridia bacterium]|nr:type II toxin-antitoxin system RelE/ParE family toxin [Clostridia bacterium]
MQNKFTIEYTYLANADLIKIKNYIKNNLYSPKASDNLLKEIQTTIENLEDFPLSGTPLTDSQLAFSYRWLKVRNYMIFYTVNETAKTVTIMRILYGASNYINELY